jgi:high affinity Mn2+ porin
MNWALMDNGAWDFAADTRGYTYGLMLSFVRRAWEVHYGLVEVSKRPNGMAMDLRIGRAHSNNLEVEHRHLLHAHPGALRAMAYGNNAHMGSYREALNTPAFHLDLVPTRAYRLKFGFGLNAEQEITRDVGVFFRAGWNDGHTETWEFTEIDRSGSGGVDVSGRPWKRPNDHFGVALVESGLSRDHREFLAAGGMGFIIGDGKLDYGREHVLEAYYAVSLGKGFAVSPDLQWAHNPAYNRDRGPVPMAALRVHWEH